MLPGTTLPLPASLMTLLAAFQPCFTAPAFRTFCALTAGFLAQTGRRTVCGMLTGAGLAVLSFTDTSPLPLRPRRARRASTATPAPGAAAETGAGSRLGSPGTARTVAPGTDTDRMMQRVITRFGSAARDGERAPREARRSDRCAGPVPASARERASHRGSHSRTA